MLGLNILTKTLMSNKVSKGMYSHYEVAESASGYIDEYYATCLELMTTYDINEKLGLSVEQLADLDPDRIKQIEDHMVKYTERAKRVADKLTQDKGKEMRTHARFKTSNRKRI